MAQAAGGAQAAKKKREKKAPEAPLEPSRRWALGWRERHLHRAGGCTHLGCRSSRNEGKVVGYIVLILLCWTHIPTPAGPAATRARWSATGLRRSGGRRARPAMDRWSKVGGRRVHKWHGGGLSCLGWQRPGVAGEVNQRSSGGCLRLLCASFASAVPPTPMCIPHIRTSVFLLLLTQTASVRRFTARRTCWRWAATPRSGERVVAVRCGLLLCREVSR